MLQDAAAEFSSNTISSNGSDGITVEENSLVQLGEDTGTSIFETANSTPSNNAGFGIRCTTGGTVDGRRGGLTGNLGPTSFAENCGNGLIP